jgi:hypothetical protein
VSYHDRRLNRRLEDPEFREEYERATSEIAGVVRLFRCQYHGLVELPHVEGDEARCPHELQGGRCDSTLEGPTRYTRAWWLPPDAREGLRLELPDA